MNINAHFIGAISQKTTATINADIYNVELVDVDLFDLQDDLKVVSAALIITMGPSATALATTDWPFEFVWLFGLGEFERPLFAGCWSADIRSFARVSTTRDKIYIRMTMCAALMVAANIVGAILVARSAGAATTPNISRTSLVSPLNFHYDDVLILRH